MEFARKDVRESSGLSATGLYTPRHPEGGRDHPGGRDGSDPVAHSRRWPRRRNATGRNRSSLAWWPSPRPWILVISTDINSMRLVRNIYDGLTGFEPGTFTIKPLLAESWDISEDGLTYTSTSVKA